MRDDRTRNHIQIGVIAFLVIAAGIAVVFGLAKIDRVAAVCDLILGILSPIIYGAVMAYLMAPVYNRSRAFVLRHTTAWSAHEKQRQGVANAAATTASLVVLTVIVVSLFAMLIPQLLNSVMGIIEVMPANIANLQHWLEQVLVNNPEVEAEVMANYDMAVQYLQNWITNDMVPVVTRLIGGLSSGLFTFLNTLKNLLIGVIVMVYLLNMKEKLVTQSKMIVYSAFPLKIANKLVEEVRFAHRTFGGFIIGKLLDSLIIGIMCFVILSLAKMPYVLLVSVIVGVTNVIPFFGPFIGAIPSAFLILLASPIHCLWFIVFIFLLQQFDGNILGPKILGDSTGLSSFWVLFSILLFGGLFGFIGMIIGVPTFAVFYRLVTEGVTYMLNKRELSADIEQYEALDHIDENQKTYKKLK